MNPDKNWLVLPEYIYIDQINTNLLFVYNTIAYTAKTITDTEVIAVINTLQNPTNLGSVRFSEKLQKISGIADLIEEGFLVEQTNDEKPMIFLPIMNLQRDLEKGEMESVLSIMGSKTRFLSGLYLYISAPFHSINEDIDIRRKAAIKQTLITGLHDDIESNLSIANIKTIFDSLSITSVVNIDIIINLSDSENESCIDILNLTKQYPYNIRIHSFVDRVNLSRLLSAKTINPSVEFVLYYDRYSASGIQSIDFTEYPELQNYVSINKIIYNESEIVHTPAIENIPIYSNESITLFKNCVFISVNDIMDSHIGMKEIMRNQKLNANCFGVLDILANGDIFPHGGHEKICNVHEKDFFLKSVIKEFEENQSWRMTRNKSNCKNCKYRNLCPPISLLELSNNIKICL